MQFLLIGARATYIRPWITSVTHLHILSGRLSCDIQCHNNDAREIEGELLGIAFSVSVLIPRSFAYGIPWIGLRLCNLITFPGPKSVWKMDSPFSVVQFYAWY